MKYLLTTLIIMIALVGQCQLKPIPVSQILNKDVGQTVCLDSTNQISQSCPTYLEGFYVKIYSAYFDKGKKNVQIIGRICSSNESNGYGIFDVEIFKARKQNGKLLEKKVIGLTTYDSKFFNNDGFFDIKFELRQDESLFFYGTKYFLSEFAVYQLLGNVSR